MEKRFYNLDQLHTYMHNLIDQLPRKDIKKIPCDIMLEFLVAGQKYIEDEILNFAKELGYTEGHPNLRVHVYQPYYSRTLARCFYTKDLIECNLEMILRRNLWGIKAVMIHELCHFSIHEHPLEFYELQLHYLKQMGLFDQDLPFEKAYSKIYYKNLYKVNNPYDIPESQKDYEKLTVYSNKVDEIFRHKIYDLSLKNRGPRYIKCEFREKIEELCLLYDTQILKFNFNDEIKYDNRHI